MQIVPTDNSEIIEKFQKAREKYGADLKLGWHNVATPCVRGKKWGVFGYVLSVLFGRRNRCVRRLLISGDDGWYLADTIIA